MSTVSMRDLRNHTADVMATVAREGAVVVTRDGEPVAEVIPLRAPRGATLAELRDARRGVPPMKLSALRDDLDLALDPGLT